MAIRLDALIIMGRRDRQLFLDILRILAISLIVLLHVTSRLDITPYFQTFGDKDIYFFNIGGIGVSIFLIVSGAVLEYNFGHLIKLEEIVQFYLNRLLRIYPAFWISLIIGLAIVPELLASQSYFDLIFQFSGFYAFLNTDQYGGPINIVGWFIGLIIVLYLIFPVISFASKNHPLIVISILFLISVSSTLYVNHYHIGKTIQMWLPICRLFEFGLGIFIIRMDMFPKVVSPKIISVLSDMSFYIFLIHVPLLYLAQTSILFYGITVMVFSIMLFTIDDRIKKAVHSIVKIIMGSIGTEKLLNSMEIR